MKKWFLLLDSLKSDEYVHLPSLPKHQYREKWFNQLRKAELWRSHRRCRTCNRQSVERGTPITFEREELLKNMLLERISLRAIARLLKVSLNWVIKRAKQYWQSVGEELPVGQLNNPELELYCLEADEMWTFVGAKDCPEWLWLAIERGSGLVVGFHLGGRNEEGALGLWLSIPEKLREKALVFTDGLAAYANVFDKGQHGMPRISPKANRRPLTLNDSTTPSGKDVPVWFVRRYPFLKSGKITT